MIVRKERLSRLCAAVLACAGLGASPALAADFPELEDNNSKTAANVAAMACGDTLSGTTTGAVTTAGPTSADYWRITSPTATPGIYKYTLTLTTAGTAGHTATLRGLTQSGGAIQAGTDTSLQTGVTSGTSRVNTFYGFGTGGQIYYRVDGTASTTSPYSVALGCTPVTPTDVVGAVIPGNVSFFRDSNTTADVDYWIYDSNFNPVLNAGRDSPEGSPGLTVNLAAGTYYIAYGAFPFSNDQPAATATGETFLTGSVTDFPGVATSSQSTSSTPMNITITSAGGLVTATGTGVRPATNEILWYRFVVANPATPIATGSASPSPVAQGSPVTLTLTVFPANGSSLDNITSVTANVSAVSGNPADTAVAFTRNGVTNQWTYAVAAANGQPGSRAVAYSITDPQASGNGAGSFNVSIAAPNDACAQAINLTLGATVAGTNIGSTNESPTPPTCNALSTFNTGVWYRFVAPATRGYSVSTCSALTDYNTRVYVYTGTCAALTCASVNSANTDQQPVACAARADASTAYFCGTAGATYFILVASDTAGTGNFGLTVTDVGPCPANDACAGATPVTAGTTTVVNAQLATNEPTAPPTCNAFSTFNQGLWFAFTAPSNNRFEATTCSASTDYNTRVYVYTGTCSNLLCVSANQTASPACGARADAASVQFCAGVGQTYYILVTNDTTGSGTFGLTINDLGNVCPPGDVCGSAVPLAVGSFATGNNALATNEVPTPPTCNGFSTFNLGLWYTFTEGATSRRVTATTCDAATSFNTRLYVYSGACATLSCVNANATASPACAARSDAASATFCTAPGQTYYILVTNDTTGTGTFTLTLADAGSCSSPANDLCSNATNIASFPFSDAPSIVDATPDLDVSCNDTGNTSSRHGVWYRLTPSEPGTWTLTETSANDVAWTAFTGTCNGLTETLCSATDTAFNVPVVAGTTYYALVSIQSVSTVPTAALAVASTFAAAPGACCTGGVCTITNGASPCTAGGGTFVGYGTTCGGGPLTNLTNSTTVSIADAPTGGVGAIASSAVTVSAGDAVTITDVNVYVGLNHAFGGDLNVRLLGPNGVTVPLSVRPVLTTCTPDALGNGADLVGTYIFDDQAAQSVWSTISANTSITLVPPGAYRPSGCNNAAANLNTAFGGISSAGTWTLQVTDEDAAVTGTITSFGLLFNNQGQPNACATFGACCVSGACSLAVNAAACASGAFTLGATCTPNPCTPATVRCCRGSVCETLTAANCTAPGGAAGLFNAGAGTQCNTGGDTDSPCCLADYNKMNNVDLLDIFAFLQDWFAGSPFTNHNGDANATNDLLDIFSFLADWFAGPCP